MMQMYAKAAVALVLSLGVSTRARQDQGGNNPTPAQGQAAPQNSQTEQPDQARPDEETSPVNSSDQTTKANTEKSIPSQSGTDSQSGAASKRRTHGRKLAQTADGEPRRIVIRRGGVSEPITQIIPGMTLDESNRLRQEAKDLLAAADSDVKKLSARNLSSHQQETVSQVHHYMDVARLALDDGDIERAHTLALKAQLLSDDLVKH